VRTSRHLQEPEDDACRHRLAGTRFTHQRDTLALVDMHRDAVQHFGIAKITPEAETKVTDEQGGCRHSSTPRISRSASPRRLKPKTATRMASPGKTVSHQES